MFELNSLSFLGQVHKKNMQFWQHVNYCIDIHIFWKSNEFSLTQLGIALVFLHFKRYNVYALYSISSTPFTPYTLHQMFHFLPAVHIHYTTRIKFHVLSVCLSGLYESRKKNQNTKRRQFSVSTHTKEMFRKRKVLQKFHHT